jgi:hypothetical protein
MQAYAILAQYRHEYGVEIVTDEMMNHVMRFMRFFYTYVVTGNMPGELDDTRKQLYIDILDTGNLAETAREMLAGEGINVDTGFKS